VVERPSEAALADGTMIDVGADRFQVSTVCEPALIVCDATYWWKRGRMDDDEHRCRRQLNNPSEPRSDTIELDIEPKPAAPMSPLLTAHRRRLGDSG
jgi:hypothetical protein